MYSAHMAIPQVRSAPVASKPHAGLVLKSGKVVIERSGGLAGLRQFSQQLDVTRLPK